VKVEPKEEDKTILHWRKGADVYTGKVKKIEIGTDSTALIMEIAAPLLPGENSQLTLTVDPRPDAKGEQAGAPVPLFWKCDVQTRENYDGNNAVDGVIKVFGEVKDGDFKPGDRIRVFEFGKGGVWRAPTKVSLRRLADGTYQVNANASFRLTGKKGLEWSADGKTWQTLPDARVTQDRLEAGPVILRWAAQ
jgi:hypothetical protein